MSDSMNLSGMEAAAKDVRSKLKQLGFKERSTARMLAKIHAHFLAGGVSGVDVTVFLAFLYLSSGMPMRPMMELFSTKTKVKKIKQVSDEQLPVLKALIEVLNPKLMRHPGRSNPKGSHP